MAAPKRSKTEPQGDSNRVKITRIDAIAKVVTHVVKWGGITACAYFFFCCVRELAGKQTDANILLQLAMKVGISRWAAYALGGCGFVYGVQQKNLRRAAVKRLGGNIPAMEAQLDPDRSSSRLNELGRTPSDP
jgi:hypothetical protein